VTLTLCRWARVDIINITTTTTTTTATYCNWVVTRWQ